MPNVRLDLLQRPKDIAVLPSGEVLLWSWTGTGYELDLYDDNLTLLWRLERGMDALGIRIDRKGVPWILDRRGASALTSDGEVSHRVEFTPPDGMEVCAFTDVDDDVIFACQQQNDGKACEPLLTRVGSSGAVRWLALLSSDLVDFNPYEVSGGSTAPAAADRPQVPSDWLNGYHRAGRLVLSGDTLLAPYTEIRRSPFGLGYVVGVTDGVLRYAVTVTFFDDITGMTGGGFLVGCAGQTTLYNGDERQKIQWNTAGTHVVRPGDIRVLETDRPLARIARLLPDGAIIRGDLIDGHHTTEPYILQDGTAMFVRDGVLTAVQDLLIVDRRGLAPGGPQDVLSTRVLPVPGGFVTTYTKCLRDAKRPPGSKDHQSGLVLFEL